MSTIRALMRAQPMAQSSRALVILGVGYGVFQLAIYGFMAAAIDKAIAEKSQLLATFMALMTWVAGITQWTGGNMPRISEFERSLPVLERDWLRAKFRGPVQITVLAFGGCIAILASAAALGLTSWTPTLANLGGLGASLVGSAFTHVILGTRPRASMRRFIGAAIPFGVVFAFASIHIYAGLAALAAAPIALWWAWGQIPSRLETPVANAERESSERQSSGHEHDDRSGSKHDALGTVMRRAAYRNLFWWLMTIGSVALAWVSKAGSGFTAFLLPVFINGINWPMIWCQIIRPFGHLPLPSRRVLFPILGVPLILGPGLGFLLGSIYQGPRHGRKVAVHFSVSKLDLGDGEYRWTPDVRVPRQCFDIGFGSAPVLRSPSGEQLEARTLPILPGMYAWNPYQLPTGCSIDFAAWQVGRAMRDLHRVDVPDERIRAGILKLDDEGRVAWAKPNIPDRALFGELEPATDRGRRAMEFFVLYGAYGLLVFLGLRPRQLPRGRFEKIAYSSLFGVVVVCFAHFTIAGFEPLPTFFAAMTQGMRNLVPVPSELLFVACLLLVAGMWRTCRARFDRMEASLPPHPIWTTERVLSPSLRELLSAQPARR